MGIGINVYFPDKFSESLKKLGKGEISKICQNALKEYFNLRELTREEIEAKVREIEYNKQRQNKEKEILMSRLKRIEEKELKEKEANLEFIKSQKEKQKEIKRNFMEFATEEYNLTKEYAIELYEEFKLKDEGIIPFLNSKIKGGIKK